MKTLCFTILSFFLLSACDYREIEKIEITGKDASSEVGFQSKTTSKVASHKDIDGYDVNHRVGTLYFVSHTPPTFLSELTQTYVTTDSVLRNQHTFDDFYVGGDRNYSLGYFYHQTPEEGFYCLFESISADNYDSFIGVTKIPSAAITAANSWECNNTADVAKRHAEKLVAAGIDYIVLDLSNNFSITNDDGTGSLLLALRPTEVLLREWDKLRKEGTSTPQIAAFAPVPKDSTLWPYYVHLYNKYHESSDLILTHEIPGHPEEGNMVFFYVDDHNTSASSNTTSKRVPDPGNINSIYANAHGTTPIRPIPMWTLSNQTGSYGSDWRWTFISPCLDTNNEQTSTILGKPCNQGWTKGQQNIGSSIAVGPSYQIEGGYASLALQSSGRLGGLTLKKQFETAQNHKPNYLLISSWNEHASGKWRPGQNSHFGNKPDVFSSGMEEAGNDGKDLFIDAYSSEYSRDIEPTKEYGKYYYNLTMSCIKRYKTNTCESVEGANCCDLNTPFVTVYSLAETRHSQNYSNRYFVSINKTAEVDSFVSNDGWRQIASRFKGPSDIPVDPNEPEYWAGPFIAISAAGYEEGDVPIYRCYNKNIGKHFLSTDASVECPISNSAFMGGEQPIFYIASKKSGSTTRALRRCYDLSTGSHFHSLGLRCPSHSQPGLLLGYVR